MREEGRAKETEIERERRRERKCVCECNGGGIGWLEVFRRSSTALRLSVQALLFMWSLFCVCRCPHACEEERKAAQARDAHVHVGIVGA